VLEINNKHTLLRHLTAMHFLHTLCWAISGFLLKVPFPRFAGAGKTTTIHCLTGVLPFTRGEALVYGNSIATPAGLDAARPLIGICPQFDTGLWDHLTGREHLQLFASIKGLPRKVRSIEADLLLEEVKLTEAGNITAGAYSGGMKRRLSVSLALLGDPKVVYLDEPTTGLDPISRRHLWDLIDKAKRGRAIVLTTHSMEEADILGDRWVADIGIFCPFISPSS
jgi:ABC-type multidrug transport system ATPase subunit